MGTTPRAARPFDAWGRAASFNHHKETQVRAPLHEFAARLARNHEVAEFITGLVKEHHVDPDLIIGTTQRAVTDLKNTPKGHLPPHYR